MDTLQEILDKKATEWEANIPKVNAVIAMPSPWLASNPEYEEEPVDIRTFIDSPDYMDGANECWPVIKDDLQELFEGYHNPNMQWKYNEAVFDEGMGSGKSYKASIIISYLLYRVLILKDPQAFLHLAKDSSIYIINMSVRGDQAKKIVFGEVVARVGNSPWFKNRGYLPDKDVKSELRFPKNVNVIPGNSRETFPLGFNLIGGVMDEAAWYTETDSHDVAEEIYNALYGRIFKRFGNKGVIVMISSPRYVDDFIENKMKEATTNTHIFSRRRATWEAMKGSDKFAELYPSGEMINIDGTIIPLEDKELYTRNPETYRRNYMAIPSLALEPYFKQYELVERIIQENLHNPVKGMYQLEDWFCGNPLYQYYMHIDLSLVSDSTGIGMVHNVGDDIIIDLGMAIDPPDKGEIDLSEILNIVITLQKRGFSIQKVTFDQFQSASSIQSLNKLGLNSEQLSVDKTLAPYETLKELIYRGKVKTYKNDRLLAELRSLELIEGKKVDHPPKGSKDIADAVAGATYNCVMNQNIFSFGFAGDILKHKTQAEITKEAETLVQGGLVPYGYYRGRR